MYTGMTALSPAPPVIERGISLHKLIRLLTHGLGGEGWLCFMGNEFGHPEWLDFPREGNGWSYHYARRQFSLADDETLRYRHLEAFDAALQALERDGPCQWLRPRTVREVGPLSRGLCRVPSSPCVLDLPPFPACAFESLFLLVCVRFSSREVSISSSPYPAQPSYVSRKHEGDKVIVFDRGDSVVFALNLHPGESFSGYRVGVPRAGTWRVLLSSDDEAFGGQGRVDTASAHPSEAGDFDGRPASVRVYLPSRCAVVLGLRP